MAEEDPRTAPELSLRIYELTKERGRIKVEDITRATGAARGTVKDT